MSSAATADPARLLDQSLAIERLPQLSLALDKLAASATEAIARQPEAGGRIFTTMIIAAALIEGVTLFGLIICLLAVLGLRL